MRINNFYINVDSLHNNEIVLVYSNLKHNLSQELLCLKSVNSAIKHLSLKVLRQNIIQHNVKIKLMFIVLEKIKRND